MGLERVLDGFRDGDGGWGGQEGGVGRSWKDNKEFPVKERGKFMETANAKKEWG